MLHYKRYLCIELRSPHCRYQFNDLLAVHLHTIFLIAIHRIKPNQIRLRN